MTDSDWLNVWYENRLVGNLWRNPAGAIGFRYETGWIESGGFPISCSLPLALDDISSADNLAHRYFANLLPEGGVREQLVRDLKIPNTEFDLLRAIGGECAGALTVLPAERTPSNDGSYTVLGEGVMSRLIARHGRILSNVPNQAHPRLSLAGAQNKCPVLLRDGEYLLPEESAPTSHILKFEVRDYRHVPAYETFTTRLAQQIGLPVVVIDLESIGKRFFTRSERYDRVRDNAHGLKRLHQEDFCQALGYGHERKYQEDGGPAFSQCLALLREVSSDPAIDVGNLLRWQIFNVLAGNSDGHAKNLSLLYLPGRGTRLAPFYDLICTVFSSKSRLAHYARHSLLSAWCGFAICTGAVAQDQGERWISLFNGSNLDGWTPKFTGFPAGENHLDTFRVDDGLLTVSYDNWTGFNNEFGHLFHEQSFSHYLLRVEYRFVGEQVVNGPAWAFRNNGMMLHSQTPESMTIDQEFPASIEVQLLGGNGSDERSTANICTPGTHFRLESELIIQHCTNSSSATFHGDQWVTLEVEVRGDELIRHTVNDEVVFEYSGTQLDESDPDARRLLDSGASLALSQGQIAIQAESHPTQFRRIDVLPL